MRLLTLDDSGQLQLTKDFAHDEVPSYAILSHTWGNDEDEITFEDIGQSLPLNKAGYAKIQFCLTQARKDGLNYAWIDTCCINKANLVELSEAITSMFRWYQAAAKCYVYLSDVTIPDDLTHDRSMDQHTESMVDNSRWFTRSWTLQELLAPSSIVFFSKEGRRLGSRAELEDIIHRTTGIPLEAIRGEFLSRFTSEQRLCWASNRSAKKPEDRAYCLIGLCEVSMSLRYGEGENAFKRLQAKVLKAPKLTPRKRHHSPSDEATVSHSAKNGILASLHFPAIDMRRYQIDPPSAKTFEWLLSDCQQGQSLGLASFLREPSSQSKLFWISGIPGSGKSSLMAYLISELEHDLNGQYFSGSVASYFFYNPSSDALQKSVSGMFRTILHTLFSRNSSTILTAVSAQRLHHVHTKAGSMPEWTSSELWKSFEALASHATSQSPILLLLDGLDEIEGGNDGLDSIAHTIGKLLAVPNVKLCVSSRPLPIFSEMFSAYPMLRLQDLNHEDISTFVRGALYGQRSFQSLCSFDPQKGSRLIDGILNRAQGVFLWVRLVVKDLISRLRDGESLDSLEETLYTTHRDLESYFQHMFDSIDLSFQVETSVMLQVALWDEPEFGTTEPLRLLDLSLISTLMRYPTEEPSRPQPLDLGSEQNMRFALSAAFRRLQSRCKGLLICRHLSLTSIYQFSLDFDRNSLLVDDATFFQNIRVLSSEGPELFAFSFFVGFLHRSLRDFFLSPTMLGKLYALTNGPVSARRYLCYARLHEAESLAQIQKTSLSQSIQQKTVSLTSHVIAAAGTHELRADQRMLGILGRLEDVIGAILIRAALVPSVTDHQYIDESLDVWEDEQSNIITLALDFGIDVYIQHNLTEAQVQSKKGRPLLDYVLRPRFAHREVNYGPLLPDPSIVEQILTFGADPNALYKGCSVSAHFVNFMNIHIRDIPPKKKEISKYFDTTMALLQAGAGRHLRKRWLVEPTIYDDWGLDSSDLEPEDLDEAFEVRWDFVRGPVQLLPAENDALIEWRIFSSISALTSA